MAKASDNLFPRLLIGEGGSTSTPAANRVTVYAKSDGLLYSKDDAGLETPLGGTAIADITDIPTAEMDDTLVLAPDGTGGVEFRAEAGGEVGWSLVADAPGTSFAAFTAETGTWSSNGTEIIQTDTGGTMRRCAYDTQIPLGFPWIMEAEMQSPTNGGTTRTGLLISDHANTNGGIACTIDVVGDVLRLDADNVVSVFSVATTFAANTWYKLRMVGGSSWLSVYLDGVLKFSGFLPGASWGAHGVFIGGAFYPGLISYGCSALFRNFKVWTLSTGAPA